MEPNCNFHRFNPNIHEIDSINQNKEIIYGKSNGPVPSNITPDNPYMSPLIFGDDKPISDYYKEIPSDKIVKVETKKMKYKKGDYLFCQEFKNNSNEISSICCSKKGTICVGSLDNTISLYKFSDNKYFLYKTLNQHNDMVIKIILNHNGSAFYSIGKDNKISYFGEDGEIYAEIDCSEYLDHLFSITQSYSNLNYLLTSSNDENGSKLIFWDISQKKHA
jgi:WD40 repeat protein